MNGKIIPLKTSSEKKTRTTVDTIHFTRDEINSWKNPPFQRPLRINEKVKAIASQIKEDGGVLPGIITLGVLSGVKYLVDGQHRRQAFLLAELPDGYTDVRIHYFDTMADMGEEFVNLNSCIIRLRPDDILRGLEASVPALAEIRKRCPFVGYDMIRRGPTSPIVSMSMALRVWRGSQNEVPAPHGVASSASNLASTMTEEETRPLIDFLTCAVEGFGRDAEYARLWGSLNLMICMWLYRRTVIVQYSPNTPRLTKDQFKKCLMSLSANAGYLDWLVGRNLGERDRSPAYDRIRQAFVKRIEADTGKKPRMPAPAWATHSSGSRGR